MPFGHEQIRSENELLNFFRFIFVRLQSGPELTIENVQRTDAGVYICLVSDADGGRMAEDDDRRNELVNPSINENYYEALTVIVKVRSVPGPVTRLGIHLSTILGAMMWEFPKNHSNGYPIISFTAEFRKYTEESCENGTSWERFDPNDIPANVVSAGRRHPRYFRSRSTNFCCCSAEIFRSVSSEAKYNV